MKTDDGLVIAEAILASARIELERLEAQLADLKRRRPDYSKNWRDYSFGYADEDFR